METGAVSNESTSGGSGSLINEAIHNVTVVKSRGNFDIEPVVVLTIMTQVTEQGLDLRGGRKQIPVGLFVCARVRA